MFKFLLISSLIFSLNCVQSSAEAIPTKEYETCTIDRPKDCRPPTKNEALTPTCDDLVKMLKLALKAKAKYKDLYCDNEPAYNTVLLYQYEGLVKLEKELVNLLNNNCKTI